MVGCIPARLFQISDNNLDQLGLPSCDPNPQAIERAALVELYNATNGAEWTNKTGWLSDAPIGEWYGVTTDKDGRVTMLQLDINNLVGALPEELGIVSELHWLELNGNRLHGEIPSELGSLSNLQYLMLHQNRLIGSIPPELADISNLQTLRL